MTEREIWTAAGILIENYGEQAAIVAAQRADEFLASGDMDGRRVWIRVMKAAASMIDVPAEKAN